MLLSVDNSPLPIAGYSISDIVFPTHGKFRSRKVISRSNSKATIKYPSWKGQRMIHCESMHELNACFLLDFDKSVTHFTEQPCRVDYINPLGKKLKHYPDFLVFRENGTQEFWEVKADLALESRDVIVRESVLRNLLPNFGYEYFLVCGRSMTSGARLKNARYLARNGRVALEITDFNSSVEFFLPSNILTWDEFAPFINVGKCNRVLSRLILEGYVQIDENKSLSGSSKIWWNSNRNELEV